MHKFTLRNLLFILYIGIMGLSITVGIYIYKKITSEDELAKKYLREVEVANTVRQLLELSLSKSIDNSVQLIISEPIYKYVSEEVKEEKESLNEMIINWKVMNPEIKSVGILDHKGEAIFRDKVKEPIITFPYLNSYPFNKNFEIVVQGSKPNWEFFIIRPIRTKGNFGILGYTYFVLDKNLIEYTLNEYISRNQASILLIDRLNCAMSMGDEENILYRDYLNRNEKKAVWSGLYDHAEVTSNLLNMKVIVRTNLKSKDSIYNMLSLIIGFFVIGIIFFFLGIIILRAVVIYPLEEIRVKAERIIEEKDLSIRFDEEAYYVELYFISRTLNKMLQDLRVNLEEDKKRNKKEQMLQLMVINHQVNPHFLFNTLNTVMMLVAVQSKDKAIALIKHLAKYYRACLTEDHTFNTIKQELYLLDEYIQIATLRNPDLIEVHIEVDETLYDKKIPRMILQTLIENCMKYGVKTIEEPLQISITLIGNAFRKGTVISVRDNGKGMDEVTRLKILEGKKLDSKSGFGLTTIIQRVRLIYGIEKNIDILNIHSCVGEYTEVKVYIPWEVN